MNEQGQEVDYAKLRQILDSPAGAKIPPALRLRMLADVQKHEGQLLEQGNIDLSNRPQVKNPDGSISTVRSFSANFDGKEVLLPQVSDDGRNLTEDEAVNQYAQTGRHLGKFASPEAANAYAKTLHEQQAAQLEGKKNEIPQPKAIDQRSDAILVDNMFRRAAKHELAKKIAIENTSTWANRIATTAMQPAVLALQVAHDLTLGMTPSPYGDAASPETMDAITRTGQIPIRIISGVGTAMLEGAALMRGLSFLGKVPVAMRYLEFVPMRLKEIGMGALINGGIDALRADGFQRDAQGQIQASWLDPSAKIGKPLADLGIPDRLALGLGGAVVGAIVGPSLMGIAWGTQKARAKVVQNLSPESLAAIQDGLAQIGVLTGPIGDKYRMAQTFIKNFRKVALNEEMGTVMADQLSREQFIANEIAAGSANNASPKVTSAVLRGGTGDMANSGFYIKPDAAVVIPHASSLEINTVDAVKGAIAKVGPEEFKKRVQLEIANRSADPLAQAAATEEVARRIMSQPPGVKSAHELLQEIAGTAFADTPAHNAAIRYAQEIADHVRTTNLDSGLPDEAIIERMLRDKMITEDGDFLDEFTPKPRGKPGEPLQPPSKPAKPARGREKMPEGFEIKANLPRRDEAVPPTQVGPAADMTHAVDKLETAAEIENDGKMLAGIFRSNPGGVNVVTGVTNDLALVAAQERLGVRLTVAKITNSITGAVDYMLGRPVYNYPAANVSSVFSKQTEKISEAMKSMAKSAATNITAPKTTEAFILHDGTPIRGGLNTTAMIEKMRMQKPVVNGVGRGDLALQQLGNFVRLEIMEGGKLHVTLPAQLSKEQFVSIGKAIDTMKFNEVTIARGASEQTFVTPLSSVVQDHIATVVKPQSVSNSITPEMASQYAREGVFKGQAAVLPDGTAGEIIGLAPKGDGYMVRETLTNSEVFVHKENLSILPSALEGEYKGSNLFASYLSDEERQSLAKMRLAMAKRWDRPITKFRDFEAFANTRGYMAENVKGGKIRIAKVNEGGAEPILFKDLKSALAWVRKDTAPMAELGSDEVTRLLGPDRQVGFIGGGGPPPRFNEMMPIDWPRQMATMEALPTNRGPGIIQTWLKPTLPLLRDLDKRFGTQMFKAASNVQSQAVARANFEALWYHGIGGELPEGVMPLGKIIKMAGKNANQELITDWREADAIGKTILEKSMSKEELKAAQELGKWYDAAYPALGVGAPFVENYMPRYREAIQKGTPQTFLDFMSSVSGDALKVPKGTDWVSDHIREGFIDAYNKDAFSVAVQYLRGGAKNRFMKEAQDEAREMVKQIASKNPNIALPLANMLQAMGGYEFFEQRAMLKETFESILDKLPKSMIRNDVGPTLSERFVNWTTSLVYASTMGFRPALALRNAKDIFVMSYPIYHGKNFYEAIGYALTKEGKEEAMAARVISNYGGGMLSTDAETAADIAKLPQMFQDIHAASTVMYDSADEFTRTGTYFAAKFKAREALEEFAKGVKKLGTETAVIDKLKAKLVKDSKVYLFGPEVEEEFLRRAATNPELAAQYAGKTGADFTNYLYGRGMQARWMRSLSGRLLGQFGSWSMWYGDYLTQLVKMAATGENKADALGILARHALVNAAILETGREVLNIDLSRWASYGALFYSGGPGVQVAIGASTLMRGFGDASSLGEDPLSQSRITQGSQMIWNTLPAFVPFHSAGRDVYKMVNAYDPTEFLAATLGTRVTKHYQTMRKIDILLGSQGESEPFQSTSPALGRMLNNMATGEGVQPVDLRNPGAMQTQMPPAPPPRAPQQGTSQSMGMSMKNRPLPTTMPGTSMPQTMETKPTGSNPIGGY